MASVEKHPFTDQSSSGVQAFKPSQGANSDERSANVLASDTSLSATAPRLKDAKPLSVQGSDNPFQLERGTYTARTQASSSSPLPSFEGTQPTLSDTQAMARRGMLGGSLRLSQAQMLLLAAWSQTHLLPAGNKLDTLLGKARAEALLPEAHKRLEALKAFQRFTQAYQHAMVQHHPSPHQGHPIAPKLLEGFTWLAQTLAQQYEALIHHWEAYEARPAHTLQPLSALTKAYQQASHPSKTFTKRLRQRVEDALRYVQKHYTHKAHYQHQPRLQALKALEVLAQFIDTHPNWCQPVATRQRPQPSMAHAPLPFSLEDAWSGVWQFRRILSDERTMF
ncbi:MAG: hypothetical protein ACKO37_00990 [Vampirovibrionales bacterium]